MKTVRVFQVWSKRKGSGFRVFKVSGACRTLRSLTTAVAAEGSAKGLGFTPLRLAGAAPRFCCEAEPPAAPGARRRLTTPTCAFHFKDSGFGLRVQGVQSV